MGHAEHDTASDPTPERGDPRSLNGVRALSVFAAIAAHMSFQLAASSGLKARAVAVGFSGMNVLFVMSGLLNASMLSAEFRRFGSASPRAFLSRRALRILPPLLVVVAAVILWTQLGPVSAKLAQRTLHDAGAALTFTTSWARVFGVTNRLSFFAAMWTLSVEVQFYLLLAFTLGWALRRWGPSKVCSGLAWLVGVFVLERAFVTWLNVDRADGRTIARFLGTPDYLALAFERVYYTIDGHADAILIGTLLGVAIGMGLLDPVAFVRRVPTGVFVAAALAVVTFWVGLDLSSPTQFWALNAFGGWTVLGLAQACGLLWLLGRRSRLGDALCHPVLQFFGDISYSAYLWHWPVMLVLTDDRLGNPPVGLRMAIQATTFVALATATRVVVELPLLARKRRFGRVTSPLR